VALLRAGLPEHEATSEAATALGKLALHEPLRADMRRSGMFQPLAEKLSSRTLAGGVLKTGNRLR
jgi:hypothetical protein